MPIRVVCSACGCSLNAPDSSAGRKAKCPRCSEVLSIPEERITREPKAEGVPEAEEVVEVVGTAKKPKRKKRRPPRKSSEPEGPPWLLWLMIVGGFILVTGSIAVGAAFNGHGAVVLLYSVVLAIMVPISTFILIVSMFMSSSLGGGIDFGDARVVIPKAVGLLLLVNLIALLPLGGLLAGPVWLFGLMLLFGLDMWETVLLVVVNWGLNYLARMAVFIALTAAFAH